jgi:glycosyltransferase involved in cell wall biosynthesis
LARYTLRQADLITTNSQAISEQVIRLGARADTLSRVQFGVELDIFYPASSISLQSVNLRRRLSLPENSRLVLSPRAIRPIYNLDIILQSIPLVHKRFPEAVFIFADYNINPDYKKLLVAISRELELEAIIRWLPPTNNRAEMAELYRMSEVVVSVPISDGTPVSVLEAMACGKPVICTDLPSLREFITNGENGWLIPVRQTAPLAETIIRLLDQPDLARDLGLKANQVVAEKANYEVEMQRMESIYDRIAGSTRR